MVCALFKSTETGHTLQQLLSTKSTMHNKRHPASIFILVGLLALTLISCATDVGKAIKVSDAQLAKYDPISKLDAIASLDKRIADARSANMSFLSPHHFGEANDLFTRAQTSPETTPKNVWVADIAKAHTLLDKAESIGLQVRERFHRELELKGLLDQFKALESYPDEYTETIGAFSKLIEKTELGKTDNIDKDQNRLIKNMQALDIKAVQYSALHESNLVNQATQHKIDVKLAPTVLGNALRVYADATKRIATTPHNTERVKHAGEEALFAAHRAWFITERIVALKKLSLEDIALEEEKYFSDISATINHKDLRDQALFKQVQIIRDFAKAATQDQTRLITAQSATQSLEKRLKESEALMQQCNMLAATLNSQIAEKDTQLKALREQLPTTLTTSAAQ